MSVDWDEASARVAQLAPAQREYWALVLDRLKPIELLAPEQVQTKLAELRALGDSESIELAKSTMTSTERLVHQLTHQLAEQLSWSEGLAVSKLADLSTENRAGLWQTLHSARQRLNLEKPADPKLDKSALKQAMPSEELCLVWRCLSGLLLLEDREANWVRKSRLELSLALEGAKSARGRRLRKLESELTDLLTNEERALLKAPSVAEQ